MLAASQVEILQLPLWIDLTAVVVGALSGAVFAVRARFDLIGVLAIALVLGLGGGIVRDLLLSIRPVALTSTAYLPTVFAAAAVGFLFASSLHRFRSALVLLDALSLGLFTVVGVEKALLVGLPGASAVLVGVAAATGGGVLRDLLSGRPPEVVRRGPWNAAAALAGSLCFVLIDHLDVVRLWPEAAAIVLTVALRLLSVYRGWETPLAYDLGPALRRGTRLTWFTDD